MNLRLLALAALLLVLPVVAQKKPMPKDGVKLMMALPFGVVPGKATKLELRGLKLDIVKEIRVSPKGSVKILSKGKVGVPNMQDASRVGDSRVEIELTIPADVTGEVELVAVGPTGPSKPLRVLLDRIPFVIEKEPNDGFKQAQLVKIGDVIEGKIDRNQDVDVYRFEAKAGQTLIVDVLAARLGGGLDAFLAIHDADGQLIESCDDVPGSTDAKIEFKAAKAGAYFAVVSDALDQGGATHRYRLSIRGK